MQYTEKHVNNLHTGYSKVQKIMPTYSLLLAKRENVY